LLAVINKRKDTMATLAGNETKLSELLHDLVKLDFDAAEAYEAAIERLENEEFRTALAEFRQDHLRHARDLGKAMAGLNLKAPPGPGAKQYLTKGKVIIADLFGDQAILMAMLANEKDTNTAYERACANAVATPEVRHVLQMNLQDERRHREWIEDAIDRAGSAAGASLSRNENAFRPGPR
jgi:rubrerythrin